MTPGEAARCTDRTAELCRLVMRTMYETVSRAPGGSPLRRAFEGLGDAFYGVAGAIMAKHTQASLALDEGLRRNGVEVQAAIVASIVADSVLDIVRTWEAIGVAS